MPKKKYTPPTRLAIYPIGPSIAYIVLTQNLYALVFWDDALGLSQWNWCAHRFGYTFYATRRTSRLSEGGSKLILMHRLICAPKQKEETDHANRNGLDNRRSNLRAAADWQNRANTKACKNSKTGLKGVSPCSRGGYAVFLTVNGVRYALGRFMEKSVAKAAYDKKADELRGEFSRSG